MPEKIRRRSRLEIVARSVKGTFMSKKEKECRHCRAIKSIDQFPVKLDTRQKSYGPFCVPCLELLTKRVCACGCGESLSSTGGSSYVFGHDPTLVRHRPLARREAVYKWHSQHPEKMFGYRIKYKFGMTVDVYNKLVEAQGNCCAICRADSPGRRYRYWCIDHDHTTGVVRGLLCGRCNSGIAALGDTAEGIKRALSYFAQPAPTFPCSSPILVEKTDTQVARGAQQLCGALDGLSTGFLL